MLIGYNRADDNEIAKDWRTYLDEQTQTASEFNPEGAAVAVDGLKLLAAFIDQFDVDNTCSALSRTLAKLAKANRTYEKAGRGRNAFDDWAPDACEYLKTLEHMTARVVKLASEPGAAASHEVVG